VFGAGCEGGAEGWETKVPRFARDDKVEGRDDKVEARDDKVEGRDNKPSRGDNRNITKECFQAWPCGCAFSVYGEEK
jgi:hypothetical protein